MRLVEKDGDHLSFGRQSCFPTMETKFQVKCRMECGWIQAENLYLMIIFLKT